MPETRDSRPTEIVKRHKKKNAKVKVAREMCVCIPHVKISLVSQKTL